MWNEVQEVIALIAIVTGYLLLVVSCVVRSRAVKNGHINSHAADIFAGVGIVSLVGGLMAFLP